MCLCSNYEVNKGWVVFILDELGKKHCTHFSLIHIKIYTPCEFHLYDDFPVLCSDTLYQISLCLPLEVCPPILWLLQRWCIQASLHSVHFHPGMDSEGLQTAVSSAVSNDVGFFMRARVQYLSFLVA